MSKPGRLQTTSTSSVLCYLLHLHVAVAYTYKKNSYRLGTARRENLPKIAEMDVEMTT